MTDNLCGFCKQGVRSSSPLRRGQHTVVETDSSIRKQILANVTMVVAFMPQMHSAPFLAGVGGLDFPLDINKTPPVLHRLTSPRPLNTPPHLPPTTHAS